MGLQRIEVITFDFLRYFHYYLWHFPVQIHSNFQRFYILEPTIKNWAPFLCAATWSFVYFQCTLITAVYIQIKHNTQIIDSLVLLILWYSGSSLIFIATIALYDRKFIVIVVNGVLELAERLYEGNNL